MLGRFVAVGLSGKLLQRSISIAKPIDQIRGTLGDQPKILQQIDIAYLYICLYKRRPKTELSQPQPQLRTHLTLHEVDCVRLSTTACALPFTPESLFQSDTSPKQFSSKMVADRVFTLKDYRGAHFRRRATAVLFEAIGDGRHRSEE